MAKRLLAQRKGQRAEKKDLKKHIWNGNYVERIEISKAMVSKVQQCLVTMVQDTGSGLAERSHAGTDPFVSWGIPRSTPLR